MYIYMYIDIFVNERHNASISNVFVNTNAVYIHVVCGVDPHQYTVMLLQLDPHRRLLRFLHADPSSPISPPPLVV